MASLCRNKNVGLDDPSYRFAQELSLFTEIKQSFTVAGIPGNVDKGLFDSTRSVLFINFAIPVKEIPQLSVTDESGKQYEQRSSKGWQNKSFMFEFEPLGLDTQNINVALFLGDNTKDSVEFTVPVDVLKTAQYTKIIYPNQEKTQSNLKLTLDKAVLGVSEAVFKLRLDWPLDGSVAGIGLGRGMAYFPTSVVKVPNTTPPPDLGAPPPGGLTTGYASTVGVNYRSEDPPVNRPALYDLTGRLEVQVQGGEYRTTQFPCQLEATLKFAPVQQETEQLELLPPPIYLYEEVINSPILQLDFQEKNGLNLEKSIAYWDGKVIVEKVWLEDKSVYLSYRLESAANPEIVLPHFELTDTRGMKQGRLRFDPERTQVIIFSLYNEEAKEFILTLDSIGQLLSREKFTLDLREE